MTVDHGPLTVDCVLWARTVEPVTNKPVTSHQQPVTSKFVVEVDRQQEEMLQSDSVAGGRISVLLVQRAALPDDEF